MRRFLKHFTYLLLLLLLLMTAHIGYSAYVVRKMARVDEAKSADAIVVMGAAQFSGKPSPVLAARLDHAAKLYKEGLAKYVIVTGGKVPGDWQTEAGASANYLISKGIPDRVILREVHGRNSWESLQSTKTIMAQRNMNTAILVSDSFHNARISGMAKELGIRGYVSATNTSPISNTKRYSYMVKETVGVAFARLFGYQILDNAEKRFS